MSNHLQESLWLVSILAEQCMCHQEGLLSQNGWPKKKKRLAKDNPETNPITIKPETASHKPHGTTVLLGSLTLLISAPVCFSNSLLLCQHTSPQTILSQVFKQESTLGALQGDPASYNINTREALGTSLDTSIKGPILTSAA